MKKFRTTGTIELHSGEIGLSEKQAAPRSRFLRKVGRGVYRITGPVQFKRGEVISFDAPPKPFAHLLDELEPVNG